MSLNGYSGYPRNPSCSDRACSEGMPHHDTVLLIYVFSSFGLILIAMLSCFYACHLYTQRCERRRVLNTPPTNTQVIESRLVPMKQAIFIEQPDGHSDVAWAITTAVDSQPLVDLAQKDKVFAALVQPIGSSSGQLSLPADQQSQSPQSHTASSPLLPHSR